MSIRRKFAISVIAIEALILVLVLFVSLGVFHHDLMQSAGSVPGNQDAVVSLSLSAVNQALVRAGIAGLLTAVIGVFATAFLSLHLGSGVTRRIKTIASMAKNMKEGRGGAEQVDQGADEIGQVSRFIYDLGEQISLNMHDLMAAEERFRIAIKAAGAGAWKWNVKTGEMYWSVGSYYALGYLPDRDKPTFELWRSAIHPEDLPRVDQAIANMMVQHNSIDIEYRIVRPNGQTRWMRSVGSMQFDAQEIPHEIYGLQIDVTRQRQLQEQLREQRSLLRAVLDNSSDSVVTFDSSRTILMVNSSLLHMFQYTESELVGQSVNKLLTNSGPEHIHAYIEQCLDLQTDKFERETYKAIVRRKDGSAFKAGISISGLGRQDSTLLFVISIANLALERRHLTMTDMQAVPG